MLRVAIVGYGNTGKAVEEALCASKDMKLTCVVSSQRLDHVPVVRKVEELKDVDVAVLCSPSRVMPELAKGLLEKGICVVDSYDMHTTIAQVRRELDPVAKAHGCGAIVASGFDPGVDSVVRTLLEVMAPQGITYTNFGPGMSMGHTVAVKEIAGVADALSLTIPLGTGLHRRMVYVVLEAGAAFDQVAKAIKADPYFVKDETHVMQVDCVEGMKDVGHGVLLERKGVSGFAHNQRFQFSMQINNPAMTAQVLVSAARAVVKQRPGCYTMIEIPPIDFLDGDAEEIIRRLV